MLECAFCRRHRRAIVWFSGAALTAVVCASGFAAYRGSSVRGAQHMSLAASGAEEAGGKQQGGRPKLMTLPPGNKRSDPVDAMSLPVAREHQSLSKEYSSLAAWTRKLKEGDKTKNFDYLLKNGPLTPPRVHSHGTDGVKPDAEIGGIHIMRSASQMMAAKEGSGLAAHAAASSKSRAGATTAGSGAPSPVAAAEHRDRDMAPSQDVSKEEEIEREEKAVKAKMNRLEEAY